MTTVKQPTEVRREQIARAAMDVIGREGMKAFTTANIAREVGISEANLYRHFKNKDAILRAVVDRIGETLGENVNDVRESEVPAIWKLERIFRLHVKFLDENSGIPRIVFSTEGLFVKGLRKKLYGFVTGYIGTLAGIIAEGQRDGSIRPDINPEVKAATLIGIIQFNALRSLLSGFEFRLSDKADEIWDSFSTGIEPCESKSWGTSYRGG